MPNESPQTPTVPTSRKAVSGTLLLLCLTSFLTDVGSEMVYPLLPFFVTGSLAAPAAVLGLIEGVVEALASVLKVYSGALSDRTGKRKPLAVIGYATSAVGKLVLAYAMIWPLALTGRLLDRTGKGIRGGPRDAMLAESVPADRRGLAFGLHRAFDNAGAALGVAIAMLLTQVLGDSPGGGIDSILKIALVPAGLGVLCLLLIKETGKSPQAGAEAAPPKERFRPIVAWKALPKDLRLTLGVFGVFALGGSSNMFLLLVAHKRGADVPTVLAMYLAYNIVAALSSVPAGMLADRLGRRGVVLAGYLVYAAIYAGFAVTDSVTACWWLMVTYGLYAGLTETGEKALVADLSPKHLRASMQGLFGMISGFGLLAASIIAGFAWDWLGPAWAFGIGAMFALVAAVLLSLLRRRG